MRAIVTLTRYAEPTALVCETLDSLASLTGQGFAVALYDQQECRGLAREVSARSTERLPMRCQTIPAQSLSYARNLALASAEAPAVLYVDPDALVAPDWAERMCAVFDADAGATVVGARILPRWRSRPPLLARASFVRDQYSLLDLGPGRRRYHRAVGAAFGVHRERLRALLGETARFDEGLGRRHGRLFGGEETDLCRRTLAAGGHVVYEGAAVAHHQILPERASSAWILRRFYYAGLSRAQIGGAPAPADPPQGWEKLALAAVLPAYALGYAAGRLARR